MSDTKERFTAWLSIAERNGIRSMAKEFGTSENYVVRMFVRRGLGLPVPTDAARNTADRPNRV